MTVVHHVVGDHHYLWQKLGRRLPCVTQRGHAPWHLPLWNSARNNGTPLHRTVPHRPPSLPHTSSLHLSSATGVQQELPEGLMGKRRYDMDRLLLDFPTPDDPPFKPGQHQYDCHRGANIASATGSTQGTRRFSTTPIVPLSVGAGQGNIYRKPSGAGIQSSLSPAT